MSEQHTLPLDFSIPSFPSRDLSWIASHARWILKRNRRTNSHVIHVQNLIKNLIDIYWQEEREKEKQRLETEARARLAKHHWCEEGDEILDLYPFALRHNRYGEFLEFVGDESELNLPGEGDLDDVEVLNEIIEWFTDNESVEGFVDAEPSEYFAALALSFVAEAVDSIPLHGDSMVSLIAASYVFQPAMKAMKAIGYAHTCEQTAHFGLKLSGSENKLAELESQRILLDKNLSSYKNERKISSKKATDAKHAKNREASQLVCEDWFKNRTNFKSAMKAAEYYQRWLEGQGFYKSLITIRNWILLHAKHHQLKW